MSPNASDSQHMFVSSTGYQADMHVRLANFRHAVHQVLQHCSHLGHLFARSK